MSEKCFCHLNGYKVKDADARKDIENINNAISILDTSRNDHEERITGLENSEGGSKLYCHNIKFKYQDDITQFSFFTTKKTSKFSSYEELRDWVYNNAYNSALKSHPVIGHNGGMYSSGTGVALYMYADEFKNIYIGCRTSSVKTDYMYMLAYVSEFESECFEI